MPTWDELFQDEKFRWREPHERVVGLVPLLRKRGARRVLDLGCGAGRHVVYLAKNGFEVYGMDISPVGLDHARGWLSREGLSAALVQRDMTEFPYPYPDGFFDAAISLYVIYHTTLGNMRQVLAEIDRVLQPGGLALLTFQSREGWRYGRGVEIEPNTFIPDTGEDRGVPHHFSDEAEVRGILARFRILDLHHAKVTGEGQTHAHWHALVEKP